MQRSRSLRQRRDGGRIRARRSAVHCALGRTVQTALVFFAGRVLDETTEGACRYIMTGQAQTAGMTQSQFATWVCGQTCALFTCGNFMINVQNSSSFSSASTATPTLTFDANRNVTNTWNYSTGNPGDIVDVQVMYQWPVVLGPLSFSLRLSNGPAPFTLGK
ncbi:MAG: pilus assembly protein [Xanthobacteraceae bacterium]|jgi:hypothetical protein